MWAESQVVIWNQKILYLIGLVAANDKTLAVPIKNKNKVTAAVFTPKATVISFVALQMKFSRADTQVLKLGVHKRSLSRHHVKEEPAHFFRLSLFYRRPRFQPFWFQSPSLLTTYNGEVRRYKLGANVGSLLLEMSTGATFVFTLTL